MDVHSSDRSSRLWLPLAEDWQECPAGLEVPGPEAALDHWPPLSMPWGCRGLMHTRRPGINPPPGGGWPGYDFSNASGPENHLAHLKTSSVPAA